MNITDICNMALSFLAKGKISSVDESSESARQCKMFYDMARQRLLREYTWGFAKRAEKLALLRESSPFWAFVYKYPARCVCVRRVFPVEEIPARRGGMPGPRRPYDRERERSRVKREVKPFGNDDRHDWEVLMVSDNVTAIGTNVPDAWAEYTYDAVDANLFSTDFTEALSHMLAFNIAKQLTGDAALATNHYQIAQAILSRAKYTAAAEQTERLEYPNKYFAGRI